MLLPACRRQGPLGRTVRLAPVVALPTWLGQQLKPKTNSQQLDLEDTPVSFCDSVIHATFFFLQFDTFLGIHFKSTSNLIFFSFKEPSETFFYKNFNSGLTFWCFHISCFLEC